MPGPADEDARVGDHETGDPGPGGGGDGGGGDGGGDGGGGGDPVAEVTARRIAVVDDRGVPRLVAEVVGDTVELRLEVPGGAPGRRSAVVLHASGPATSSHGQPGPGPLIGVQLWAEGDAVAELDAWPGEDGHWRPHLHLSGGS